MKIEFENYKRFYLYANIFPRFIDKEKYVSLHPETELSKLDLEELKKYEGFLIEGFEPMLNPKFFELYNLLKKLEKPIIIETVGVGVIKEEMFSKLNNVTFDLLVLGNNPDVHDFLFGKKSFEILALALKKLKKNNVNFFAHIYTIKSNYKILTKIINFLKHYPLKYIRFIFPRVSWINKNMFDVFMPFASLVAPEIKATAKLLFDLGIDFHVENMSYCLMPYFERYVLENDANEREKFEICNSCSFNHFCKGYFKDYLKKSKDDLKPFTTVKVMSKYILHKDSPQFPPNPFVIYDEYDVLYGERKFL